MRGLHTNIFIHPTYRYLSLYRYTDPSIEIERYWYLHRYLYCIAINSIASPSHLQCRAIGSRACLVVGSSQHPAGQTGKLFLSSGQKEGRRPDRNQRVSHCTVKQRCSELSHGGSIYQYSIWPSFLADTLRRKSFFVTRICHLVLSLAIRNGLTNN